MHRHVTKQETIDLIKEMRRQVPGIHIRTTLMVGYPGETDDDFAELKDFVKEMRFERMGAFTYSEEEGTYAAIHQTDNIPQDIKQKRLDELMGIQEIISTELNEEKVGKTFKVVVDRQEGDYYVGRTEYDSPEVDPEVLIKVSEKALNIGSFYQMKVTSVDEYDLYATTLI
jgi:ribosomal protein S12 methylthiotransferase